jgi:hypothetical protein
LVRLFADDTSLSYSSTNLLQIGRKLHSDMTILNTWTETWLVKFNPQKTEFVIFSNNKNIDQVNILFNGENIKQVEYHTHLGVCLSSNCKWCYHIFIITKDDKFCFLWVKFYQPCLNIFISEFNFLSI